MFRVIAFVWPIAALVACTRVEAPVDSADSATSAADDATSQQDLDLPLPTVDEPIESIERSVLVTLDGEPLAGAIVIQGGTGQPFVTGDDGRVVVPVDMTIVGELVLMASYPSARTEGAYVWPTDDPEVELVFDLDSFQADNEAYVFNTAGVPDDRGNTTECGHCHARMKDDWYASPHRTSASNVVVQDVYAGTVAALTEQADCVAAGGNWWDGLVPGTASTEARCYLGAGALPDLNEDCGDASACDGVATEFGQCADCHAPAINGAVGGRDLLAANGIEFEAGVHCDLCHKVESIAVGAEPGVAGWLRISRPLEEGGVGLGPWQPLAFGPYQDVPNPRMGAVARDHFTSGDFCGGCHQLDQAVLIPGAAVDPARWPDGRLPVHSTHEEWRGGPFAETAPCSSCHMPADPELASSADLTFDNLDKQGIASGWQRPPGAVRRHSWVGPRTPASGMLELAAAVFVDKGVDAGVLTATVTVKNVGAGHAIPTGEPLRSILMFVQAKCGEDELRAVGGDVVPSFGGWLDRKPSPEDWSVCRGPWSARWSASSPRTGGSTTTASGRSGMVRSRPSKKGCPVCASSGRRRSSPSRATR